MSTWSVPSVLVYYQASGQPGVTGSSIVAVRSSYQLDVFTLGGVDVRTSLFIDHRHANVFIHVLN